MKFNAKINILRITSAPGSMGHTEVANVLHKNLPCRISWKSGSEKVMFDKDSYFRDAKLFCRMVDITKDDRVLHNGTTYKIVDVKNAGEKNRGLVLNIKLVE
jgi:hypothetical protein